MVDVEEVSAYVQVFSGMHIADFGCGRTGHLTFPIAKMIGDTGIMYAVDILKDVLENIRKRAAISSTIHNVHTVWVNLEVVGATAIPEKTLDAGLLVNVLSQSDNRHAILDEARRLLKDKGRLVIIDWSKKGLPFGPADVRFVDFEDITAWARLHGFVLQTEFAMGAYHRGIVLFRHD
jgi:ubiquinone/menaquinone biosynthesis C-methylase UbiE